MQLISVEQLKARIDAGETLHLLDVREPGEHADFNIGGVLLPLGKVQTMQLDEIEDWKDQEVICYCRSGNRSQAARELAARAGRTELADLEGGMLAWAAMIDPAMTVAPFK